jgi:O-antigen/teichoic acid export membrane protein
MKLLRQAKLQGPIARSTVRTTFVLGLRLVLQAGTLLLVARMLGPQQFGAFAGVAALAVILGTLSTFGTHLVLLGEVSKEPARREQVLPWAIPMMLLCGSVLLGIYLLTIAFVLGEAGIAWRVLLVLGIAETLLQPLITLCVAEHHGLGYVARSQLLQILPLVLRLTAAGAVFGLRLADPLGAYVMGYGSASLVALALVLLTLPAPWPSPLHWRAPRKRELRATIGYAALNITAAGPTELDKTLATKLLTLGAAGLYAAGARIIGAATLPVIAMTSSALPRLFREGLDQPRRTRRLLRWMFGTGFAYGAALAGGLWLVAPVFNWVFGAKYEGIGHVIRLLGIAIPGMALRRVAGSVLMALGRPWMRVTFEAAGLLILVLASILMTRAFGAVGMPLALACSEWTMAVFGIATLARNQTRPSQNPRYSPNTTHRQSGPTP